MSKINFESKCDLDKVTLTLGTCHFWVPMSSALEDARDIGNKYSSTLHSSVIDITAVLLNSATVSYETCF